MQAVIYARYSSDQQRDSSIEDQLRLCKERISVEGWHLTEVFVDRGISGSTALRPGYQRLLDGAREAAFDVVVAEALDRLSRDQEDVAALYKRLQFAGIQLVTLAEGHINELHVGLKGTMNALFIRDLASKTRRGMRGRVEAGKSGGGLCFGYRAVRTLTEDGSLTRGDRSIDPAEAVTVRRIFQMFADGSSPIAIARALNTEGIPGPLGHAWRDTTIRGHALRGTGILRNELYVGRMVWNRMRFLKDPATGKRVSRMNPSSAWVTHDMPELRIVDNDLWDHVQARLDRVRDASGANAQDRSKFWEKRRSQHLLTGKLFCGACGGAFSAVGKDSLACGAARRQSTCSNRVGIRRPILESVILDALRSQLMTPELTAEFVAEFTAEWNRAQAEACATSGARQRELDTINRKLSGLIDAIADGLRAPGLQQKLDDLGTRKAALERGLQDTPTPAPRLLPNLSEVYRQKVANLAEALHAPDFGVAALEAVRTLIERVVLHPAEDGSGLEIELIGEIASMVSLALDKPNVRQSMDDRGLFARSVKVVAGTRNHREWNGIRVAC